MDINKAEKPFAQYFFDNHEFNGTVEDFFKKTAPFIGSIVHSFNSLDSQLNSAISSIINDRSDEFGAIVTYKMSFTSKVDLFYRLVRSLELAEKKEISCLKSLIENQKKCAKLRNAVVHAEWDAIDEQGYTYAKLHIDAKGIKQQYWQFTPESLDKIDEFIHNTFMLFEQFDEEKQSILCS